MKLNLTSSESVNSPVDDIHARVAERLSAIENEVEGFFNRVPFGSYTESADGTFLFVNTLALAWMGHTSQELIGKRKFIDLLSPSSQEIYRQSTLADSLGTVISNLHLEMIRRDGSVMPVALSTMKLQNSATKSLKNRFMIFDLTQSSLERRRREENRSMLVEALRASEERRAIATESGRVAIWEVDLLTGGLTWDENCFLLYKISKEGFKGTFEEWSQALHPDDRNSVIASFQNAISGIGEYETSFRILWPNGEVRFIQAHGRVIQSQAGISERMIGTNWDITEQKRIEQALQMSVYEKSALLKEVHHRVKNNLQVITSLLRLESRRSTVNDTQTVLSGMQARIHAMALLHESLYRAGTFASVNMGGYLSQLSTQAFQTQSTNSGSVQLELNLGSVQFGMDQAIPCGLLVNELLSNCLKHGFPDGVTGQVSVDLQPLDTANLWQLRVFDTGIGLPDDFEEKRKYSLGLQLAVDLARQIGGELKVTPNQHKGVEFTVNFKAIEPASLVMPV